MATHIGAAQQTTSVTGKNYIGGRWRGEERTFESRNPAGVDQLLGTFPRSTASHVSEAVAAARKAFPAWRRTSRIQRGDLFDRLAQLVKRDLEELTELLAREAGKPINEARADVVEGLHMIQYVFGTARTPYGDVVASELPEKDAYLRRKPRGVVAVVTPWNFPFAIPLWMIGPSLVEGNTVVFKPSEETPAIAQRLVELFEEAGLPPGVLNLVHGIGEEAGDALVRHPDVDVVCFTGSYEVGRHIQEICASDFRKIAACEMGSKSSVIVLDDARMELAVRAGALSAFKTSGQRCVSAGRILVHRSRLDQFAERFVALAKRIRIGDPLDPEVFMGPLINQAGVEKVLGYNDLARREGAEVLLEGGRLETPEYKKGWFLSPFVYRIEYGPKVRAIREEVFGPHVALVPFDDLQQATEIYNDTDYGLSMGVITEDYRKARYLRDECDYGMGYVNLPCIGAEVHLPFGGVKKSGNGRPSAAALIDTVTHKTAWTINHDTEIHMAQGLSAEV
ncbi:MAG: aldehyde dehydrogenase family protein [Pirellulales bacterium]